MGKLTFIAGMAAGYVLGSRAGRQRYEQIRRTSGKVWNSGPVQKQVFNAKEVARTKAAPWSPTWSPTPPARPARSCARAARSRPRPSRPAPRALRPTADRHPAPTGSGADPWAAATSRTDGAA